MKKIVSILFGMLMPVMAFCADETCNFDFVVENHSSDKVLVLSVEVDGEMEEQLRLYPNTVSAQTIIRDNALDANATYKVLLLDANCPVTCNPVDMPECILSSAQAALVNGVDDSGSTAATTFLDNADIKVDYDSLSKKGTLKVIVR